ncbi:hypothetical protein B932_2576 [Gluconobacter oxydans H24]|nr:hypothetical protein B932_2576 [Gluconobacter oxydans H24]
MQHQTRLHPFLLVGAVSGPCLFGCDMETWWWTERFQFSIMS